MIVKLDTILLNDVGENLVDRVRKQNGLPEETEDIIITLYKVITRALFATVKDDADKVAKYEVWVKAVNQIEADWETEEIVLIKDCINKVFGNPLVVGQAFRLLEGKGSGITRKENTDELNQ